MKLKIVSDGTISGTKVQDENGQSIGNISFLSITADAEMNLINATIEMLGVPFEYTGDVGVVDEIEHVYISKKPISIDELLNAARKN